MAHVWTASWGLRHAGSHCDCTHPLSPQVYKAVKAHPTKRCGTNIYPPEVHATAVYAKGHSLVTLTSYTFSVAFGTNRAILSAPAIGTAVSCRPQSSSTGSLFSAPIAAQLGSSPSNAKCLRSHMGVGVSVGTGVVSCVGAGMCVWVDVGVGGCGYAYGESN